MKHEFIQLLSSNQGSSLMDAGRTHLVALVLILFLVVLVVVILSTFHASPHEGTPEHTQKKSVHGVKTAKDEQKEKEERSRSLSEVKVAVLYQRINDGQPPDRTLQDQIDMFKELHVDMIFRAWWRWRPCPDNLSEARKLIAEVGMPKEAYDRVVELRYTYDNLRRSIEAIKKELPGVIICGAIPAQKLDAKIWDEITGRPIPPEKVRDMAFDPEKFGLHISFEEAQEYLAKGSGYEIGQSYYPDITNPDFRRLMLEWAEKQIDAGVDAIWIDCLFRQALVLYRYTKDPSNKAVEESYKAACELVDEIHRYGLARGKRIYVGTWAYALMELPYKPCNLDFVTISPRSEEILALKMDEQFWDSYLSKIRERLGNVTIFAYLDWSTSPSSPTAVFSQKLTPAQQREFLKIADRFFRERGVVFIYPLHGGCLGVGAKRLAFGRYYKYDALAPEFDTYEVIKELAESAGEGAG